MPRAQKQGQHKGATPASQAQCSFSALLVHLVGQGLEVGISAILRVQLFVIYGVILVVGVAFCDGLQVQHIHTCNEDTG